MSLFPKSVISDDYLDLRQTTKIFWIKLSVAVLLVLLVVWFKNNILGYFAEAAGMDAFVSILRGPIYLWIALAFLLMVSLYLILDLRAIRYQIYKDRVVVTNGILQRNTLTVKIETFPQIELTRSLFGRLLNYGTILFQYGPITSLKDVMVRVENIDQPEQVTAVLQKIFDTAQPVSTDGQNSEIGELR